MSFTKSDLKHGMWVKYRNGEIRFVTYAYGTDELIFTSANSHHSPEFYHDDLIDIDGDTDLDIVEVFKPELRRRPINPDNLISIWRREEPRKMTVAEVEAALGYPVEIVSGEGEA